MVSGNFLWQPIKKAHRLVAAELTRRIFPSKSPILSAPHVGGYFLTGLLGLVLTKNASPSASDIIPGLPGAGK